MHVHYTAVSRLSREHGVWRQSRAFLPPDAADSSRLHTDFTTPCIRTRQHPLISRPVSLLTDLGENSRKEETNTGGTKGRGRV